MKKIILPFIIVCLILFNICNLTVVNKENNDIPNNLIADSEINYNNAFYKDIDFDYVQNTTVKIISNKQDILNILYTMLNNSYDSYDVKCSSEYKNCVGNLLATLNDRYTLNVINNLVSTYNSSNLNINISYLANGIIRITADKKYTKEEIEIIDSRIDYIISMIITENMSDREKVRKVHDYLTNNITYGYNDKFDSAYGALVNGIAICTGYSDTFSLFMDKLDIPNYKVVSNNHVWNVVNLDGNWQHIDLTWDDPQNDYGISIIKYDYFLISTQAIRENDLTEHNFNLNIYSELV